MINGYNGKMLEYVGQVEVKAGKSGFLDFQSDRVIKDVHFMIRGDIKAVFTGTTPRVRKYGIADGLIKSISVQRKGGDDLRNYLGVRQIVNDQLWNYGERGPVLFKKNALTLGLATSANIHEFGLTNENCAFYEGYVIGMENRKSSEYWRTYFSTKGNKSAKIIFNFGQYQDVLDPEDTSTAPVITGNAVIDVYISKADHLLGLTDTFEDFKHNYDQIVVFGAQKRSRQTIQPEAEIQGIWVTAVKGVKDTDFTHEELLNTSIEMKFDGETIVNGSLLDLSAINMSNSPIIDMIRGSVFIPFLNNKTYGTGLFTGEGASIKPIEIYLTTDPAMSYVGGVKFIFEYDRVTRSGLQAEVANKK